MTEVGDWRRSLSRAVAGLIALKLVALLLIKVLFFPADRAPAVGAELVSRHLGLDPTSASRDRDVEVAHD